MAETFSTPFGDIDPAAVDAAATAAQEDSRRNIEEITIKFAKGLCSEPFVSREGKELVRIQIPNSDPADHDPWQEFVLGSNQVHENRYGKGLWAKIPADGYTTVSRPFLAGRDENGKNVWKADYRKVPNRELKEMVEFYRNRGRDERDPAPQGRQTQEKAADGRSGKVQKAEPEPEGPGDKAVPEKTQEKASVKDQLAEGRKEAAKTKAPKAKAEKKQNMEPEL